MNSLRRDLFERRLWPIAVVLILAIVAVPFVIGGHHATAKGTLADDAPVAAPPPTTTDTASTDKRLPKVMHRLSSTNPARDPFGASTGKSASATPTTAKASATSSQISAAAPSTTGASVAALPSSTPSSSGGSVAHSQTSTSTTTPASPSMTTTTTATMTTTSTAPAGTATAAAKAGTRPATHHYTVRVVDLYVKSPGGAVSLLDAARLTPLPAASWPKVMYMGTTATHTAAVFALGASVSGTGPARCEPSHRDCALIALTPGHTETLTYPVGLVKRTLELKVTRISARQTTSKAYAQAAYARHSQAGLCALQLGDPIQYQYATADGALVARTGSACTRHGAKVPFPGSAAGSGL